MPSPFRRTLPSQPDLEQQKKLAKELLHAFQRGETEAGARVRAELPDKTDIRLADAQYVLAREYGFGNWAELARHIEALSSRNRSPLEQMQSAVQKGDARAMRKLLTQHSELRALVNEPLFPFDSPALVHFAGSNNLAVIDVLLEFGADPNRKSGWWAGGFHPLHSASDAAAERLLAAGAVPDACAAAHLDRPDLLAQILEADASRVHERGGDGQTPLHFARSRRIVELLLDAGADPDARDVDHRATPAQWMVQHRRGAGRYELARYLVERGATPDIFLAAALGLVDRVREMVRADPRVLELKSSQGEYAEQPPSSFHIYTWTIGQNLSPLQVAAQFEQTAVVDLLLTMASPRQRFLAACMQGDESEARALLRGQPDLVASLSPQDQRALPDAGWAGNARAVALMLELGFEATTPGQDLGTVLHCAAWQGEADCVAVVLRHPAGRALVAVEDATHHSTPLGWCCHGSLHCRNARGDYPAVARLLIEAGAKPADDLEASPEVMAVLRGTANRRER
jgi:ankyrin repeat protein